MPDHQQGQKNADDVGHAYQHFQDLCDKHMPSNTTLVTDQAYNVSVKGNLWP